MSYTYTGYQLRQADYHPWQPVYPPPHHPIRALDQQPSYPLDGRLHPQHHPYQGRQPTSWDPPWLRQENAYQQPSSNEPDLYSPPPPTCWDPPWFCTQQGYSQYDQPYQPPQQPHHTALRQPTCWDPPIQQQQLGFQLYDQPQAQQTCCWEPPLTATIAANQPHEYYQQPPLLSRSDCPPWQPSLAPPFELPPLPVTAPLFASDLPQQAAVPSSINELETNMHECEERMEIQVHVDEHKAASETTKQDLEVGIEERRRLFKDELGLESEELVQKGGAELGAFVGDEVAYAIPKGLTKIAFSYVDLHISNVTSMNYRSALLDEDARLIPPRMDKRCLSIRGCVDKIPVLALYYHDMLIKTGNARPVSVCLIQEGIARQSFYS